jgi:hypothetical protein
MGHVLSCGRRQRLVLLPAVLLLFAVYLGTAKAATPSGATVSSLNPSASFTGHVSAPNFLNPTCDTSMTPQCPPGTSPSPCPHQVEDPMNVVCEHFTVNAAESGTVSACVGFPPGDNGLNDIDLYIVDSNNSLVASSLSDADPECVAFPVVATLSYEIHINPFFIETLGGFDIQGSVVFTSGSASGQGKNALGPEMEGGGKLLDGTEFNIKMAQFEPKERKLKVKSPDHGPCAFKATDFAVVQIYQTGVDSSGDPTGKAHIEGNGLNSKQQVTFVADVTDGGEHGSGDTFTFSTSDGCFASGPLQHGDVDYEVSK